MWGRRGSMSARRLRAVFRIKEQDQAARVQPLFLEGHASFRRRGRHHGNGHQGQGCDHRHGMLAASANDGIAGAGALDG